MSEKVLKPTSDKVLKPTSDLIFKLIFGNTKNVDILSSFLQAVLDLPKDDYDKIYIIDPHLKRETMTDKLGILDVKLQTKSGKVINIEIQVSDVIQMKDRVVFYSSKMVTEQVSSGDDYNIKKVINIIITDYKLIKDSEKYHHKYQLYDIETGSKFTDIIEINTLEIPKIPTKTDDTSLWGWLKFLGSESEEEFDMIAKQSPEIGNAVGILKFLSHDQETRELYNIREKNKHDEQAKLSYASLNGAKEKAYEVAKELLNDGLSFDKIIKYTNLTYEEIESLQNKSYATN